MRIDPEEVASAALRCPSVSGLFPGAAIEIATYLPGKRVLGVRVRHDDVEVHVVARWGQHFTRTAEEVRLEVAPLVGDLPVSVYVDDVAIPEVSPESREPRLGTKTGT